MDEPMTMNRVIHAAVRRDLARLDDALARVDTADRERAEQLARAFAFLHAELTRHHESEDRLIFPMLAAKGADPVLVEEMEAEHHDMAEALGGTAGAMSTYAASGTAADAAAARTTVTRTREVVDRHRAHEESELEPVLLPQLESAEWKAVEKRLRKEPPRTTGRFFAWLGDGMDQRSRDYLTSVVPAPVRLVFAKGFGRSYSRNIAPAWRQ